MSENKEVATTTKKQIKTYDFNEPSSLINMADTLKTHIARQGLFTKIGDKAYVNVEGWQFAGGLVGVYPMLKSVNKIDTTGVTYDQYDKYKKTTVQKPLIKYEAEIELMNKGIIVGRGYAVCTNSEKGKGAFEEYAISSMAQTRATGKAYRLLLGWVMKVAGYEATPEEEMTEEYVDVQPTDDEKNNQLNEAKAEVEKANTRMELKAVRDKYKGLGKVFGSMVKHRLDEIKASEVDIEKTYIFTKEIKGWGVEAGDIYNEKTHMVQGGTEKLLADGIIKLENA